MNLEVKCLFHMILPDWKPMSRVIEAVQRVNIPAEGLIVAVSGGADSVALLLACVEAKLAPLSIAHINHQLRGEESEEDERFVRQWAEKWSVPVDVVHRPIIGDSQIEVLAREARYQWWTEIAKGRLVATAHTADDQAETVLHRIIRGTGIHGLRGMENRPGFARPFLRLRKQDLIDYLVERNQSWRSDSSNNDQRFTRNRIRHEILPSLTELNPRVSDRLIELADQATECCEFISRQASQLLRICERRRTVGDGVFLERSYLDETDPVVIRELFRLIWTREGWPQRDLTASQWRRLGQIEPGDYPSVRVICRGMVVRLFQRP